MHSIFKTLLYRDILHGLELKDGKVKPDEEFWSNLNFLIGEYDTKHTQYYEIQAVKDGHWRDYHKITEDDGVAVNTIIDWIMSLNIPLCLFNIFILDIQKSFKENNKLIVSYSFNDNESVIEQIKLTKDGETRQYYDIASETIEQQSLSFYLRFEYNSSNFRTHPRSLIKYEVTEDIRYDEDQFELTIDTYYLTRKT